MEFMLYTIYYSTTERVPVMCVNDKRQQKKLG